MATEKQLPWYKRPGYIESPVEGYWERVYWGTLRPDGRRVEGRRVTPAPGEWWRFVPAESRG